MQFYKTDERRKQAHNITYTQAGISCFYDSEMLNLPALLLRQTGSSFVHLMKLALPVYPPRRAGRFSAENPRLCITETRYKAFKKDRQ
jgi:hypothetical protein